MNLFSIHFEPNSLQRSLQSEYCKSNPLKDVLNQKTFQNLAPIYEELADAFAHAKDKVIIAKVDADGEGKPLGKKYDVSGYPSAYQHQESACHYQVLTG